VIEKAIVSDVKCVIKKSSARDVKAKYPPPQKHAISQKRAVITKRLRKFARICNIKPFEQQVSDIEAAA